MKREKTLPNQKSETLENGSSPLRRCSLKLVFQIPSSDCDSDSIEAFVHLYTQKLQIEKKAIPEEKCKRWMKTLSTSETLEDIRPPPLHQPIPDLKPQLDPMIYHDYIFPHHPRSRLLGDCSPLPNPSLRISLLQSSSSVSEDFVGHGRSAVVWDPGLMEPWKAIGVCLIISYISIRDNLDYPSHQPAQIYLSSPCSELMKNPVEPHGGFTMFKRSEHPGGRAPPPTRWASLCAPLAYLACCRSEGRRDPPPSLQNPCS